MSANTAHHERTRAEIDPWPALVDQMRYSARIGDRVLIDAPVSSMAAPYNGMEGSIADYPDRWPGWVLALLDEAGDTLRFRPDELKQL